MRPWQTPAPPPASPEARHPSSSPIAFGGASGRMANLIFTYTTLGRSRSRGNAGRPRVRTTSIQGLRFLNKRGQRPSSMSATRSMYLLSLHSLTKIVQCQEVARRSSNCLTILGNLSPLSRQQSADIIITHNTLEMTSHDLEVLFFASANSLCFTSSNRRSPHAYFGRQNNASLTTRCKTTSTSRSASDRRLCCISHRSWTAGDF